MSLYIESEETRKKKSESKKGNNYSKGVRSDISRKRISEGHIKRYSRIIKKGRNKQGKQEYALVCDGIILQKSISIAKLKKHPIYNRTINLTRYKCFDCIYYAGRNRCFAYKKMKYNPQCCILFNFSEKRVLEEIG